MMLEPNFYKTLNPCFQINLKEKPLKSKNYNKDISKIIKQNKKKLKLESNYKKQLIKINPLEDYKENQIINGDEEHIKNPKDMNDLRRGLNNNQQDILNKDIETRNITIHKTGEDQKAHDLLFKPYKEKIDLIQEKINYKKINSKTTGDGKIIKRWEGDIIELKKDFEKKKNENEVEKNDMKIQIKKSPKKRK